MKLPPHFVARSFFIIALVAICYVLVALVLGWDEIRSKIFQFPAVHLLGMAILSLFNYALRFFRWEMYLRVLGCRIPFRQSLGLYFSAYVMVITPGKVGEVFKAAVMRERWGIDLARGLPVVLAERLYDILAVMILAVVGFFFWPGTLAGLTPGILGVLGLLALLVLLRNLRIRSFLLGKLSRTSMVRSHGMALDSSLSHMDRLLSVRQMVFSLLLTTIAWVGECLGLWLACAGLKSTISVGESTFVYAAGTLLGSLSFLPGGLGGTEAVIIFLLQDLQVTSIVAASAAFLVRVFTLWLAVFLGLCFYLVYRGELFSSSNKSV